MNNTDLLNLNQNKGFRIIGAAAGDRTGQSVSNAGDINGDGINDIIVGAVWADPNGRSDAGAAYIIYGKRGSLTDIDPLNLTQEQGFKVLGAAAGDWAGYSVSNAGDINGDGINDIIVGAYRADPNGRSDAGAAYMIYGKRDGLTDIDLLNLTQEQGFKVLGAAAGDWAGYSVSNAGDINGDGINDIIVGAYRADPNGRSDAGAAYMIYGKRDGLTDIDLLNLTQEQGFKVLGAAAGDVAGYSVSNAGDINGDGINDIIVGAPVADPNGRNDAGAAYVIYGVMPDTLSYASYPVGIMVNLSARAASGLNITANYKNIIGSNYTDSLTGDADSNNIQAGAGDDSLEDGGGSDVLTGGPGADTFIISLTEGDVVITDFDVTEDKIDFGQFGVSFSQVMEFARDKGENCEIMLEFPGSILDNSSLALSGKNITLLNIHKDNITESCFEPLSLPTSPTLMQEVVAISIGVISMIGCGLLFFYEGDH